VEEEEEEEEEESHGEALEQIRTLCDDVVRKMKRGGGEEIERGIHDGSKHYTAPPPRPPPSVPVISP